MRHPRSKAVAATPLLLAFLVAMPLAAHAAGRVAIVNGIPGKSVDVCVGTNEIKSRLAYGKATVKDLGDGAKVLRYRKASAGKCKGEQLAKRTIIVENGDDLTIVGTRFAPSKVLLFDNAIIPTGEFSTVVMRHAADIGVAGFKYVTPGVDGQPWFHVAADQPWSKGNWGWGDRSAGTAMLWWAHRPPSQRVIAPFELITEAATRHESILVGTNPRNLRFARFKVTDPS